MILSTQTSRLVIARVCLRVAWKIGMIRLRPDLSTPVGLPKVRTTRAVLGGTILIPESNISMMITIKIHTIGNQNNISN